MVERGGVTVMSATWKSELTGGLCAPSGELGTDEDAPKPGIVWHGKQRTEHEQPGSTTALGAEGGEITFLMCAICCLYPWCVMCC